MLGSTKQNKKCLFSQSYKEKNLSFLLMSNPKANEMASEEVWDPLLSWLRRWLQAELYWFQGQRKLQFLVLLLPPPCVGSDPELQKEGAAACSSGVTSVTMPITFPSSPIFIFSAPPSALSPLRPLFSLCVPCPPPVLTACTRAAFMPGCL